MQAGATLSMTDMRRNGILDVDAVYKVVYSGKGKMYGFGEGCTPKVGHFFLCVEWHQICKGLDGNDVIHACDSCMVSC
jgi:hypothetical protein